MAATSAAPVHSRDEAGTMSSSPPQKGVEGERRFGDPDRTPGPLASPDKAAVAKENYRLFMARSEEMSRKMAEWEVNEYRRRGATEARLMKEQDRWICWVPRWFADDPERSNVMNKLARLCRKLASQMFADPPAPEAIPASGEDVDADAAEVATRVLTDIQSEGALDDVATLRHAFDLASTYDSGFVRYYVDPRGGGKKPIEIEAGYDPGVSMEEAMEAQAMGEFLLPSPPREATTFFEAEMDPETGTRWPFYQKRYVRSDGTLTEVRAEAATRWIKTLESEVLTGKSVRLIPHTAMDVGKARGVQIGFYETWGNLKEVSPELANLPEERKQALFRFRPKQDAEKYLTTGESSSVLNKRVGDEEGGDRDAVRVFCIITYYRACDEYPKGLYLWTCGESEMVVSDDWVLEEEGVEEPLLLPVVQVKQFQEGTTDPLGVGLCRILGNENDLRGQQVASFIDYLDWLHNRKGFIPTTSNIRSADMEGGARWLRTVPGGAPEWEEIPDYPSMAVEMFKLTGEEMDEDAGLAGSEDLADAESGRQAYAQVSQMHAGLSEPRQFVARAYVRGCRIQLQMVRAFFDREQTVRWLGEDNRYKMENWTVSDLRSTKDVRLAPGTLTGLTSAQKTQLLEHYSELQIIPPAELREALQKNLGGTIALQDNKAVNRIRGQLSEWAEGPPEEWEGSEAGMVNDPAWGMWEPVESDTDPEVAAVRYREIRDFMQTHRYRRWPKPWRQVVIAEYERMGMASGVVPQPAPAPAPGGGGAPAPAEPMPGGIVPPDTVPPELIAALPPEQAGIPGADVGDMPVGITA